MSTINFKQNVVAVKLEYKLRQNWPERARRTRRLTDRRGVRQEGTASLAIGHTGRMSVEAKFSEIVVQDIVADPRWFLEDYDVKARRLRFVRADRDTLATQPFLGEGNWDYRNRVTQNIPEAAVLRHLDMDAPLPCTNFIWHTAFCCSTLIARALDREGCNLSLKEPGILLTLADAKRQHAIGAGRMFSDRFPELVFRLLNRPFETGEQVTVKPCNMGNYTLRDSALLTRGKHLFLYSDCRSFLISIAKKKEYGRHYARELYSRIVGDGNEQARWTMPDIFLLSDLQIAAIAWHMQIAEFQRSLPAMKSGRAVSLDCNAFLAAPLEILIKIDAFFGLGLGRDYLASVVSGPLFSRHSKSTEIAFGIANRLEEHGGIAAELGRDLDEIVAWSYEVCKNTPRGAPLGETLIALDKAYHP